MWRCKQRLEWCIYKPRSPKEPTEVRGEAWYKFSLRDCRMNQPYQSLDIRPWPPDMRENKVLWLWTTKFVGSFLWQAYDANTIVVLKLVNENFTSPIYGTEVYRLSYSLGWCKESNIIHAALEHVWDVKSISIIWIIDPMALCNSPLGFIFHQKN